LEQLTTNCKGFSTNVRDEKKEKPKFIKLLIARQRGELHQRGQKFGDKGHRKEHAENLQL